MSKTGNYKFFKKTKPKDDEFSFQKEVGGHIIQKEDGNDYEFEGIASSYGNADVYGDIFLEGSLDGALGKSVAIMPNHSWDITKAIGSGVLSKEGKKILIKGEFIKEDEISEKIVKLKKAKVPLKLSIGGRILESKIVQKDGKSYRGIVKAEIYEVSVVFRGANPTASITKNHNMEDDKMTLEQILKAMGITPEQYETMKKNAENFKEVLEAIKKAEEDEEAKKNDKKPEDGETTLKSITQEDLDKINKAHKEEMEKMDTEIKKMQKAYTGSEGAKAEELKKQEEDLNVYIKTGVRSDLIKKTLNTGAGSGGALLPTNKANEIIKEVIEMSPVFMEARSYTIAKGNQLTIGVKNKGTNNAHSQAEGAAAGTESGSNYTELELKVAKITDKQSITQEMRDDSSFNALGEVVEDSKENIALTIADRCWNGVIATDQQFEGIYTNATVLAAALETATASTVTWEDLKNMIYTTPKNIRKRSAFKVSTDLLSDMRGWADNTGRPLYIEPLTAGEPGMFMGYKVTEDVDMDNVADGKHPAFFGDMKRFYATLTRKGVTLEIDRQADEDEYLTYVRARLGGRVRQASQGKLLKVKSV